MKKLRWPILIVMVALAAIAVLLFNQQTVLEPILPNEIEPTSGGLYSEGLVGSFNRLNPVLDFSNPADRDINRLIFSGLLRFDDRGLPVGDLANSWGVSQDGTVYNFDIRANAVWHDGKPVTSDDVIFTIDMLRDPDSLAPDDLRALWNQVEVKRLDEKALQFRLPEPFAPFLDYLTFGVLPQHILQDLAFAEMIEADFNLQPVGSGPYRFDRLIVENDQIKGVVLKAFESYYDHAPYIEQFVFRYYPDSQAALAAYQNGEIMGISEITADVLPAALKEPNLRLYTGRLPQMAMIFLNHDNPEVPFLADPVVRRAMLLGLNRQWVIDHLLSGQAIQADGPIFPNTWAYYEGIEHINYDPEAALRLLREAGYALPASGSSIRVSEEGVALQFDLFHPDDDTHSAIAEAFQRDWARLGIQANLVPMPYAELVTNHLDSRLYHAALVDINLARSPDPDPYPFWHQTQVTGGQNYARWDNFQASEYLEQARLVVNLEARARNYRNFQVLFSQELPALPLFYPVYTYGADDDVQGLSMGPLFDTSDRFATVANWFLLVRRAGVQSPTATP